MEPLRVVPSGWRPPVPCLSEPSPALCTRAQVARPPSPSVPSGSTARVSLHSHGQTCPPTWAGPSACSRRCQPQPGSAELQLLDFPGPHAGDASVGTAVLALFPPGPTVGGLRAGLPPGGSGSCPGDQSREGRPGSFDNPLRPPFSWKPWPAALQVTLPVGPAWRQHPPSQRKMAALTLCSTCLCPWAGTASPCCLRLPEP